MEYINLLNRLSLDIYKSQKLSKEDICLEQISDFEKLFLFGFYEYYDELDKFDINSLNFYGLYKFDKNLLMIAAYYNKIRLIKYLLARGVDINIFNESGQNAYLIALNNTNIKIKTLKLLEDNGINIYKIDQYKDNAFMTAIIYNIRPKIKILEYLKSRSINIHILNMWKENAYFYTGNIKTIKFLEINDLNIHYKHNTYCDNIYLHFFRYYNKKIEHNKKRLLKYLKSRGVRNYYSNNYKYCDYCGYNKILKHLLISNSNNRYKTIVFYI
jgi:ankyrin repeat protein